MTCGISRFQDGGSLNNYITIFLAEGILLKFYLKFFILWNVSKQILMLGDRKPVPPPYMKTEKLSAENK
jgi:hypothetical protein